MNSVKSRFTRLGLGLFVAFGITLFAVFWIWFLAHRAISVPSGSMLPTLQVGDYLWPSTLSYGFSKETYPIDVGLGTTRFFASPPKRGDVAVFRLPREPQTLYIKRIIGLPGDKVQLRQGRLFINGAMIARKRVTDLVESGFTGVEKAVPTYEEMLPEGASYTIIEIEGDTGAYDDTPVYEVPAGHYFVLGDNRDNSMDSRTSSADGGVGMVPYENFVARVERVMFSAAHGDRFFQQVH